MRLKGKAAVISGAANGIGLATARQFCAEGAKVFALDIGYDKDSPAREEFGDIINIKCDVCNQSSVERVFAEITEESPSIDILVNNAGVNPDPQHLVNTSSEDLNLILETNLKSIFYVSGSVIPMMTSGGVILNIASILGLRGVRSCAAYSASKGAVIALSRAMAKDYAPAIRVNSISPGAVETAMFDRYLERVGDPAGERQRVCREIPLQRLGSPDDIASAAVFLASDDSSWITGHNLVVDGGDSI